MNLFLNEMNQAMSYLHFGWPTANDYAATEHAKERKREAEQQKAKTLALLTVPRCAQEVAKLTESNKTTANRRLVELLQDQKVSRKKIPSPHGRVWHYVQISLDAVFDCE